MQALKSTRIWLHNYQECTPMHYVTCQWQSRKKSPSYFLYRLLSFVWFIEALTLTFIQVRYTPEYWLVFYTHWSFLLATIQSTIALVLVSMNQAEAFNPSGGRLQNKVCLIYEYIHSAAVTQAVTVTILYWTEVYDPSTGSPNIQTIQVHAINSVMMLLDLSLVAFPIRFITLSLPLSVSILYLLFNFLYYQLGGKSFDGKPYIYAVMDWRNPKKAGLVSLMIAILLIALFCLIWLLSLLKRVLHSKIGLNRKLEVTSSEQTIQISTIA